MTLRERIARAQALLNRKPESCYGNISYRTLGRGACPKCKSGPTEPCGRIGEHVGHLEDAIVGLIAALSSCLSDQNRGIVATAICSQPGSVCHGQPCNDNICETALGLHGVDADVAIAALRATLLEDMP